MLKIQPLIFSERAFTVVVVDWKTLHISQFNFVYIAGAEQLDNWRIGHMKFLFWERIENSYSFCAFASIRTSALLESKLIVIWGSFVPLSVFECITLRLRCSNSVVM